MATKKLITHNGSFHADDLFACATICVYLEREGKKYEIHRTRDDDVIKKGDYVFDVGGIYDPDMNRFDHHQKGGAGKRKNKIPYASFGLVWKHIGIKLCNNDIDVWNTIERKIVIPIDANDNGIDLVTTKYPGIFPYSAEGSFLVYSPTWKEIRANIDDIFAEQVKMAMALLEREMKVARDDVEGRKMIIEAYKNSKNKKIVQLDTHFPRYLLQSTVCKLKEPIYVVYPGSFGKNWSIEAVSKNEDTIESRMLFPQKWRGFLNSDPKLKKITGVEDVLFSHNSGFLIMTASKEGAMEIAKKALEFKNKNIWRL